MNPEIYIDAPESFVLPTRYLRLRGWCFQPGTAFKGMRLVLPDRQLFGRYGISRPDVRAAFPAAPDDHTGFELWAIIPGGEHSAKLQFQDASGNWHTKLTVKVSAPRKWQPLWSPWSNPRDLVEFQLGVRPSHAPRAIEPEHFPAPLPAGDVRPKITVVTPSYNQARFLGETIESVLEQRGVHLTYVVQDGGSTDGSTEVIRHYASRLSSWVSEKDEGQADAIAKGFARTTGHPDDIMAWLNSDDVYLPGALQFVVDYFSQHPEVDVLYGQRVLIDEDSREVGRWFLPPHSDEMLKLNDYVPQEALFWRRRIWNKVDGIDTSFKFAMDWDLLLRFERAGAKIVCVPYFLACFRIHSAQKTSQQMESLGHLEIGRLRTQTQGRKMSHDEVERHPQLLAFLRKSAWLEFLPRHIGRFLRGG